MKNERRREIQDLERLSAYLDHALSSQEQQRLEARLEQDQNLKAKLETLRITKGLLGKLPHINAPHNFTLTPDMVNVRRKKRQPLFTTLRWASSLAAIVLVVLLGVELFLVRDLQGRPPFAPKVQMEVATMADEAPAEPLILWAEPRVGDADMEFDEPEANEEPQLEMMPLPADEEEAIEAEILSMEAEPEDRTPILGINPDEGGEIIHRSQPASRVMDTGMPWPDSLRWLQVALAAIAIGGGVTIWFLQRRNFS